MKKINRYQERYWKEMLQIKFRSNYIDCYFNESEKLDRYINMFWAVTTNGSICSWAVWNELQFLWGVIIALSQLINAIKGFLPYSTRKKYLLQLSKEIQSIFLLAEKQWYEVAEGKLTENDIHRLTIELREKFIKMDNKYFTDTSLPEKPKLIEKAKTDTQIYFNNFYGN